MAEEKRRRKKKRGHDMLSGPQFQLRHVYAGGWYAPGYLGYWTAQTPPGEGQESEGASEGGGEGGPTG